MRASCIFVLLMMALAGCGAGPRPAVPSKAAVVAPSGWRVDPGPGAVLSATWWESYNDPVLNRLVETALSNNDDVEIAAARVLEARAQSRLAHSARLPTLGIGGQAQTDRDLNPVGFAEEQTVAAPLAEASFDLDLFGRLRAADAAGRAALLASESARDTVRLAVATSAASDYITLRSLDARLGVAQATLADRASALHYAKRRAEAGYTSMLELRQAEAEYQSTAELIPKAQLAVTQQENALRLLLGDVPGPIARGLAIDAFTLPVIPDGLPSDLLRRRPDIEEAEDELVAADHTLDSARAAFLPDISLSGSAGAVLTTLLPNPVTIWSIGGSVLAPLFEGGRLTAQANSAAARRDQAAFAYRKTALTAFRDVEDDLAATTRTKEELAALEKQRTALAGALKLATSRYNAGYAPYIDQLDAQRGLLSAQLSVIDAQASRLTTSVSLYQAMGGGWTPHHQEQAK